MNLKNILTLVFMLGLVACTSQPKRPVDILKPEATKPVIVPAVSTQSHFEVKSKLDWVKRKADIADCIINNEDFRVEVSEVKEFSHFDGNGQDVVKSFDLPDKAIVRTYYKKLTRAAAYREPGSNEVYINTAKTRQSKKYIPTSLVHEWLHVLKYKHKGNRRHKYNNSKSVPYYVAETIAVKYLEDCSI